MSEETPVVEAEPAAARHYCPICANTMYLTTWSGIYGWYCDECEYFEPVI